MNLEHKEKQLIFDEYARSQGYDDFYELFERLQSRAINPKYVLKVLFEACDLVQKKALERASENILMKVKENYTELDLMDEWMEIDKESITNEQNLIK